MGMMIDVLSKRIADMKDLRQSEERKDNKLAQNALDLRYKKLTTQSHSLMMALQHTKENLQFQLSEDTLSDLEKLLTELRAVVRSGLAEKDAISQAETDYKTIQQSIKKEWSKQYSILTNATISTLQVISRIEAEHVSRCLDGIEKGAVWTTSIEDFKMMEQSLSDAKTLINRLGLDRQIIAFLQKMNDGKATLVDLDDNVLKWLKEESLDKRVKLSFLYKSK